MSETIVRTPEDNLKDNLREACKRLDEAHKELYALRKNSLAAFTAGWEAHKYERRPIDANKAFEEWCENARYGG